MNVLATVLEVTLLHKTKSIDFLVFPDADSNETLLGIDFLKRFNVVTDFASSKWYFADTNMQKLQLHYENVSLTTCA